MMGACLATMGTQLIQGYYKVERKGIQLQTLDLKERGLIQESQCSLF